MRSKASYFSISLPLIKENLRRLWAIPVVFFLVYFLSGVFPILMAYRNINNIANYIEMSLHNLQPFYMGAHLFMPVLTAVILYRYLQATSSVAVMHSLPFTRDNLFNSNFVSGIILTVSPIVINGIILLLISKPAYKQWGYGDSLTIDTVNVFTRVEIVNWIWTSIVIVLVLYTISVFAGIITGNNLMHLFMSFFFIFIVSILYTIFNFYFDLFLFGFNLSGDWDDIALSISPYTGVLNSQGSFSVLATLYYILTFVVMIIITKLLYNRRKLERATDSLTFEFMKPIICYIITFLGMTLLGIYFKELGGSMLYMYTGFAAGTVISFIIAQMIVTKSIHIFNKSGLKSFLVYALIAILFLVGLNVDAAGFERRVPNPQKVDSIIISDGFNSVLSNYHYNDEKKKLKDPENIKAITEFHRNIVQNKNRFENPDSNRFRSNITIEYDTGGILNMNRAYNIDYEFFANNEDMAKVFESLEYKAINSLYNLGAEKYDSIRLYGKLHEVHEIYKKDEIEELIACMEKDLRDMSFEDLISIKNKYATAEISYSYTDKDAIGRRDRNGYANFSIPHNASNTINWLKNNGYNFDIAPESVEYINIYSYNQEVIDPYVTIEFVDAPIGSEHPLIQITDINKIEKILETYDDSLVDYNNGYRILIKVKVDEGYEGYFEYITGYLNEGIDFLK
ncbi:MAG: hypothetical protein GX076_04565 [Clostridiales bacterium]|nr:hypothetical protein [Clostridiales bacterium]